MAKLTATQQAVVDKMRAGAVLESVSLGNRSGAAIQFPDQQSETVSMATLRALSESGVIILAGRSGHHKTWTLAA